MVVGEVNSGEGDAEAQLPLVPKGSSSISMTCLCLTHSITQTHNHNHNLPHATTTFSSSLHNRNPLFQLFSVSNQFPLLSRALFQSIILRPRIRPFSTNLTASYSSSAFAQIMANFDADSVTYLTQRDAAEIDETLMGPLGFSVDQLMVISFFIPFSIFFYFSFVNAFLKHYLTPFIPNFRNWMFWASPLPFLRYFRGIGLNMFKIPNKLFVLVLSPDILKLLFWIPWRLKPI